MDIKFIEDISKTIRYHILRSTTLAQSGHLTSSLSAVELMSTLFHGNIFTYDIKHPENPYNDILIFSKGHASPLFYALWASMNGLGYKELDTLRQFKSRLEGHPTLRFPFTFAPTGSLGQGLSIGIGTCLANRLQSIFAKTYVLLGDGEMTEGSNWESLALASHYNLNNLCAIVDVNRLEQAGPTMLEWDTLTYQKRFESFGWDTLIIDGHNISEIKNAYTQFQKANKPFAIIAKTVKGKGIPTVENNSFHGKTLSIEKFETLSKTLFKDTNINLKGSLKKPSISDEKSNNIMTRLLSFTNDKPQSLNMNIHSINNFSSNQKTLQIDSPISTRKAYGIGITTIAKNNPYIVALDAGTSNSTYSEIFKKTFPERYYEMFIAEQNMIGVAIGLSRKGFIPFVSTFASFITRAFDQLRMGQYAHTNINICGSHCGVSFGLDGPSQFGLEDIAMMRSIRESVVLYPSDGISTMKLIEQMTTCKMLCYLRTTRMDTPIIYSESDSFSIGGSKTLRTSQNDEVAIIGAGVTIHESLKAYEILKQTGIHVRVIDLYSIKPVDLETIKQAVAETKALLIVEDHYQNGGIYSAVCETQAAFSKKPIYQLAVSKEPMSGQPHELLKYEEIDSDAIVKKVCDIISC